MFPIFKSNFRIVPEGASIIYENLGFHKNNLFGGKSFFIFTTFPVVSNMITSIGVATKKVCIPNLVSNSIALDRPLPVAPIVFCFQPFRDITPMSIFFLFVEFSSTYLLYNTLYVAEY